MDLLEANSFPSVSVVNDLLEADGFPSVISRCVSWSLSKDVLLYVVDEVKVPVGNVMVAM